MIPTPSKAHMGHSFPTQEWIDKVREHEARKKRVPLEDMLDDALLDFDEEMWYNVEQDAET